MSSTAVTATKKESLLERAEALQIALSGSEKKVLINAEVKNIGSFDDRELIDEVKSLLRFTYRDLGLQTAPDAYDCSRFMQLMREHYSDLTLSDLKSAFELYIMKKLDSWLPDRFGHFQKFSASFYLTVIDAYRRYQGERRHSVRTKISKAELMLTSKEESEGETLLKITESMRDQCISLLNGGGLLLLGSETGYWVLQRLKILQESPSPTQGDIQDAKMGATRRASDFEKMRISNLIESAAMPEDIMIQARLIAERRVILSNLEEIGEAGVRFRFQWLIDQIKEKYHV